MTTTADQREAEPTEADGRTAVSVVARIDPFLMRTGVAFAGNVQALAEQMTRYIAKNLSARFTADHADAGLFVAVAVSRGDESGGYRYDEGKYDVQPAPVRGAGHSNEEVRTDG